MDTIQLSRPEPLAPRSAPSFGTPWILSGSFWSPRNFQPAQNLACEARAGADVLLFLEGFAYRYTILPQGARQIIGFLLPGDVCEMREGRPLAPYGARALTVVRTALLGNPLQLAEQLDHRTRFASYVAHRRLIEAQIAREWVINVAGRSALERLAHLFCELFTRLRHLGLATENACTIPLTQTDLADCLGLTAVHVNRTLMTLRRRGLLELRARVLTIQNHAELQRLAGFDPTYLQLESVKGSVARTLHE